MIPAELLTRYETAAAVDVPDIARAPDMAERSLQRRAEWIAELHTAGWCDVGAERWLFLSANFDPAARIETQHGTVLLYAPPVGQSDSNPDSKP